jgi:hypothetical protein
MLHSRPARSGYADPPRLAHNVKASSHRRPAWGRLPPGEERRARRIAKSPGLWRVPFASSVGATRLGAIAAIAHRTPQPRLASTLVDEQPPAAARRARMVAPESSRVVDRHFVNPLNQLPLPASSRSPARCKKRPRSAHHFPLLFSSRERMHNALKSQNKISQKSRRTGEIFTASVRPGRPHCMTENLLIPVSSETHGVEPANTGGG